MSAAPRSAGRLRGARPEITAIQSRLQFAGRTHVDAAYIMQSAFVLANCRRTDTTRHDETRRDARLAELLA